MVLYLDFQHLAGTAPGVCENGWSQILQYSSSPRSGTSCGTPPTPLQEQGVRQGPAPDSELTLLSPITSGYKNDIPSESENAHCVFTHWSH